MNEAVDDKVNMASITKSIKELEEGVSEIETSLGLEDRQTPTKIVSDSDEKGPCPASLAQLLDQNIRGACVGMGQIRERLGDINTATKRLRALVAR